MYSSLQSSPSAGLPLLEAAEDGDEKVADLCERLVVVRVQRHLEIEPDEFGQVPVSVRVLRAEHCDEQSHRI